MNPFKIVHGKLILAIAIFSLFLIPTVAAQSFYEDCADTQGWSTYWSNGLPTVQSGTWVFDFPVGFSGKKQANWNTDTGYGTYEIRMKMTDRVPGCNAWVFLYKSSPWNEIDFAEIWGSHADSTAYDLAFYVNGKQTLPGFGYGGGIGYWYPNVYSITGIAFDDNNWHTFRYEYSATDIVAYLDGIKFFQWSVSCTNKTALGIPAPPMQLMIGGKGDGTQAKAFTLTVDYVMFTAAGSEGIEPDPTPEPDPVIPDPTPTEPETPVTGEPSGGGGGGGYIPDPDPGTGTGNGEEEPTVGDAADNNTTIAIVGLVVGSMWVMSKSKKGKIRL